MYTLVQLYSTRIFTTVLYVHNAYGRFNFSYLSSQMFAQMLRTTGNRRQNDFSASSGRIESCFHLGLAIEGVFRTTLVDGIHYFSAPLVQSAAARHKLDVNVIKGRNRQKFYVTARLLFVFMLFSSIVLEVK